jgi:hypothetical protein
LPHELEFAGLAWILRDKKKWDAEMTNPPPPLEWISSPPLVAAVLIKTKGDESPGSSRMGVIGALVIFSI